MKIIFDIETIPDQNLPETLKPIFDKGRLVDPVKIETAEKEFNEGLVKKLSVNPLTCQIVSLQIKSIDANGFDTEGKFFETLNDEASMLKQFWYAAETAQLIIGHNIIGFDLPVIFVRSMIHGILPTRKIKLQKYRSAPIFDTMHLLGNWSQFISMDDALIRFGLPTKTGHGSQVYQMWLDGQHEAIHQYCQDDVNANERLFNVMRNFY